MFYASGGVQLADGSLLEDFLERLYKQQAPMLNKNGTNQHRGSDNITPTKERGTSAEYTLRRLKRDRPELAELVINGKMSANAGSV